MFVFNLYLVCIVGCFFCRGVLFIILLCIREKLWKIFIVIVMGKVCVVLLLKSVFFISIRIGCSCLLEEDMIYFIGL